MNRRTRFFVTAVAVLATAAASAVSLVEANAATTPGPLVDSRPAAVTTISLGGGGNTTDVTCTLWVWAPGFGPGNPNAFYAGAQVDCPVLTEEMNLRVVIYSLFVPVRDSMNVGANHDSSTLTVMSREIPCYPGDYQTYVEGYLRHTDGTEKTTSRWSEVSTIACPNA